MYWYIYRRKQAWSCLCLRLTLDFWSKQVETQPTWQWHDNNRNQNFCFPTQTHDFEVSHNHCGREERTELLLLSSDFEILFLHILFMFTFSTPSFSVKWQCPFYFLWSKPAFCIKRHLVEINCCCSVYVDAILNLEKNSTDHSFCVVLICSTIEIDSPLLLMSWLILHKIQLIPTQGANESGCRKRCSWIGVDPPSFFTLVIIGLC